MAVYSKSHLLCCELYFLIIVIISFLSSIRILQPILQDYVNQFETFVDLSLATINCRQQINLESREDFNNSIFKDNNETVKNDETIDRLKYSIDYDNLPICPIDQDRLRYYHDYELNSWLDYSHIQFGGKFRPIGCKSRQKVAIIVPYRDRASQLEKFSLYIHQFLPDQLIEYSLFIIEQADDKPFNRAKLFNIGVEEINKIYDSTNEDRICCYIFHDVDMLPLDQKNLYMCTSQPRHMGPNLSTLRFKLLYPQLFGGAIALTREHFDKIGGFSNEFYGWGGEDDDAFNRVIAAGLKIDRTPLEFGDYHMMKHVKSIPNPNR